MDRKQNFRTHILLLYTHRLHGVTPVVYTHLYANTSNAKNGQTTKPETGTGTHLLYKSLPSTIGVCAVLSALSPLRWTRGTARDTGIGAFGHGQRMYKYYLTSRRCCAEAPRAPGSCRFRAPRRGRG